MSVAEEMKLLAACSKHLRPIVIAALDTGMRRGEITNQIWEDVDFDRKLISVTHSKTPEGEHRLIPMTSRLHELLANLRKPSGIVLHLRDRLDPGSRWTARPRGQRAADPSDQNRVEGRAPPRRAFPHYRFHDLRHTFNSRLAEIGIIADVRKELMGHSGGGDVHSMYTHIELPTLRDAIHRLETWHATKCRRSRKPGKRMCFPTTAL